MSSSICEKIKSRVPLRVVSALLGIELPGDGVKFRSPFRRDKVPSCTVRGNQFTDWSRGDHLDQIGFFAAAKGVSPGDAIRDLAKIFQIVGDFPVFTYGTAHPTEGQDLKSKSDRRATWPAFQKPSIHEISQIAELRGLGIEGVKIAAERGLLFCTTDRGSQAWAVTDSERVNARIRRLDGVLWYGKSKSLPPTGGGQDSSWPLGIREAQPFPVLILVEGECDLLAAFHLLWCARAESWMTVVAMLGAAGRISAEALPFFQRKRVRIFEDNDPAGERAAQLWTHQLSAAGAAVDRFSFSGLLRTDGLPVKDMNDFAHICSDQWENDRDRIESAFNFSIPEASNRKN